MDGSRPFDSNAEAWRRDMVSTVSAFQCSDKYLYRFEGEVRPRACGRCAGCVARDKRDRASRAAAQAAVAVEVIGLTLTFATLAPFPRDGRPWVQPRSPGLDRFLVEDVQRFLARWRRQLWRDTIKRLGITERQLHKPRGEAATAEKLAWVEAWKERVKSETATLFYLRVGERGARRGRRHYHLAVFADKPTYLEPSPTLPPRRGERRGNMVRESRPDFWEHGTCTVDVMPGGRAVEVERKYTVQEFIRMQRERIRPPSTDPEQAVNLCRYLHKYLEKGRGISLRDRRVLRQQADVVFGSSNRKPLGVEWIKSEARRWAQAGLPFPGMYTVPGVRFSRASATGRRTRDGRKIERGGFINTGSVELDRALRKEWLACDTPQQTKSAIFGRSRDHAIAAYLEEWRAVHRDALPPMSDFCQWYDKERAEGDYRVSARAAFAWPERKPLPPVLPPRIDPGRRRLVELDMGSGRVAGWIKVYPTGSARWLPKGEFGNAVFLNGREFSEELPFLGQLQREKVERRIAQIRGPNWLTPLEWDAAAYELLAARDAAVASFAKPGQYVERLDMPVVEEDTALRRQLRINGAGHHHRMLERMERRGAQTIRADVEEFPVERLFLGATDAARSSVPVRKAPGRKVTSAPRVAKVPLAVKPKASPKSGAWHSTQELAEQAAFRSGARP